VAGASRGRRATGLVQLLVALVLLGVAAPAAALDPDERPSYAIQNRKYLLSHELTLAVGTVPIDAFYKGLTGTFQYTIHFGTTWAWEVVSFSYSQNFWTSLREDLENNWRNPASPTAISELRFFGDSNLILKPLYGKLAYLNRSLVYGELYLALGPAAAQYTTDEYHVGGDVGVGFRVYLARRLSARLDLRYYRFQRVAGSGGDRDHDDVLFIQLGLSLNLGKAGDL
jgi:outer membrane beta-barrel protein